MYEPKYTDYQQFTKHYSSREILKFVLTQDLSEGGGQDFLGTKQFIIRNQKSRRRRKFFLT